MIVAGLTGANRRWIADESFYQFADLGMELVRVAAREAVTTLRHEPVMAEDFGAQPDSPQIACLKGLRQADLVALILGEHYGAVQPSGLSATHEEYREAKGKKPVIAFVQDSISPDPQQAAFIKEVQGWEGGLFRGSFTTPSDLKIGLTRALYDYALTTAVGPVDQEDLIKRAELFLPQERRGYSSSSTTTQFTRKHFLVLIECSIRRQVLSEDWKMRRSC